MKKNSLLTLVAALSILFVASSCEKDNNDPAPKTKTELITSGSWKFSSAVVGTTNVNAFLQTCQKDNIMTFTATGLSGTLDEGLTKCNAGDPQSAPFTWSFGIGETTLNVSATLFTGGSNTFTLVSLTETNLVLSQMITVSGTPQNAVVTFVH